MDYYKEFGLTENATEDQIRSAVGAPSVNEEKYCMCGELLDECPDSYSHMTMGV